MGEEENAIDGGGGASDGTTSTRSSGKVIKIIVMRSGKNNSVQKGLAMALKRYLDIFDLTYISLGKENYRMPPLYFS